MRSYNLKNKRELVFEALRRSHEIRRNAGFEPKVAINPFDFAASQNIQIKFVDIPSLEGMYVDDPQSILIGAHRPISRQTFTCAHELGHYYYDHGEHIDTCLDSPDYASDEEEFIADCFASFFLMPRQAIDLQAKYREIDWDSATPVELYKLACWFGVSYSALLNHLCFNLRKLSWEDRDRFDKLERNKIYFEITQVPLKSHLVPVDRFWDGRTIDISVGEYVLVQGTTELSGDFLSKLSDIDSGQLFQAASQGICNMLSSDKGWSVHVRVSRQNYVGLGKYRHLEE